MGRYIVIDRLGGGGMGDVYAAWDEELRRRVALKLIRSRPGEDLRAQVLAEARALARLQHPHVVAVHDVGEEDGVVFVSMALLEGHDVRAWAERYEPDAAQRLEVLLQCAEGLAAAHDAGLVHHDVKPSNVMVEQRDVGPWASLIDFGLAAEAGEGPRGGTPAYMAPESRASGEGSARADQWSLALLGAELLSGTRPSPEALERGRLEGCGPATAALRRALSKDPSARFEDVHALARALRRAVPRRRAAWVMLGATSALAVGTWLAAAQQRAPDCRAQATEALQTLVGDRGEHVGRLQDAAPDVADSVQTLLMRWDARWLEAHAQRCESKVQPVCLEGQAREVSALLEVGERASVSDATRWNVLGALTRAVDPQRCATTGGQSALTEPLAQAFALEVASNFEEAVPIVERELAEARSQGNDPVALAALHRAASLALRRELPDDALEAGEEAMTLAARLGDAHTQSRVAFDRVEAWILRGDYGRATETVALARAFVASAGDPPSLLSYWHFVRGRVFETEYRHDDAVVAYGHALEIRQETAPGTLYEADALRSLGHAQMSLGACEPAAEHLNASIELYRGLLGPASVSEAHCLSSLAMCEMRSREVEAGSASFSKAEAILERAHGSKSEALAKVLTVHAGALVSLGDYAAALPVAQRAHDIRVELLGMQHPQTITSATNLGWMLLTAGELEAADSLLREAWQAVIALGKTEDSTSRSLVGALAAAAGERGDLERALEFQHKALALAEAAPTATSTPEILMTPLINLAELQAKAGKPEAEDTYLRVLAMLEAVEGAREGRFWAHVHAGLAKLALGEGDRVKAQRLYAEARSANTAFSDAVLDEAFPPPE